MPPVAPPFDALLGSGGGITLGGIDGVLVVALAARMMAAVTVGTRFLLPDLGHSVRLLVALVLVGAALPTAAATAVRGPAAIIVAGELVVGLGLGVAAACVGGSAAWAGAILGSVAGLTWADDFATEGDAEAAGTTRLAWWLGLAGWCAAGGPLATVAAVVDGVAVLPVGCLGTGDAVSVTGWIAAVTSLPATACALALSLALPALAAVVTFHAGCAICLRTIRLDPGPGLLQACAGLVLVAALWLGCESWTSGWGGILTTLADEARPGVGAAAPGGRIPPPEVPRG